MSRRAVIIGGGLAGIAAAVKLADAGWRPTILETTNLATAHAAAGHCWIGDLAASLNPGTS